MLSAHGAVAADLHGTAEPDFWLDPGNAYSVEDALGEIEQTLSSAHNQTGLNAARANYGFTGAGQTVAVIDSGIAYRHYALGGGLGAGYRVVGGWDFTDENDADPNDDGPKGSHGSHVAGIIGGTGDTSGNDVGVAPGVDLVGLRVFDDAGAGYFNWVESALQWVISNRTRFANPITAVNLSLGTAWNSTTIPNWTMLEDEFAALKAAGVFIAVSAGNSFTSYNTPGLSYPASSPHVVPVMSVDDSGTLSYFSQRHTSAIAAPGRIIRSTVPDYAGNNNGVDDDWANFSGTSMAAPYVAAASVLIRQAMQFVGYTTINQTVIFNHMMNTADTVFDSATGLNYKRLNVARALDSLMPADDFGSTVETGHNLGTVAGNTSLTGVIGRVSDVDYFRFTAGATGNVTFTANATNGMTPTWASTGTAGITSMGGGTYTMQVVAGQSYALGLGSTGAVGKYTLDIASAGTVPVVDWQSFDSQVTRGSLSNAGTSWYRVVATRNGYFTAEALGGTGSLSIDLYNPSQTLLASGGTAKRAEVYATAGQEILVRLTGTAANFAVRMTNAVTLAGNAVSVTGTGGNDTFSFTAGPSHTLNFNGVSYAFSGSTSRQFTLNGSGGSDAVSIIGKSTGEVLTARLNDVRLVGGDYWVAATNCEDVSVNGGGGADVASFYDTAGDDQLSLVPQGGVMNGVGYRHAAAGFGTINAYSTAGGNDQAHLTDSNGNDTLTASPTSLRLQGAAGAFNNYVQGFKSTFVYATSGGTDTATYTDTAGDDLFVANHFEVRLWGAGNYVYARQFDSTTMTGSTGVDRAYVYDSPLNDRFTATPTTAEMRSTDGQFRTVVNAFDAVAAFAVAGGSDLALFTDSAADDVFVGASTYAWMQAVGNTTYSNYCSGFENVQATASGGNDHATLYDSAGDDTFTSSPTSARMLGTGYSLTAAAFENVYAHATAGGTDTATLADSTGDDTFTSNHFESMLRGGGKYVYAREFDVVTVNASTGVDRAYLYDSPDADRFTATPVTAELRAEDGRFRRVVNGFDAANAFAVSGGTDTALFYDSAANDVFVAGPTYAWMQAASGTTYSNYCSGFESVQGFANAGGIDYATFYDSAGNDTYTATRGSARLTDVAGSYSLSASQFEAVTAIATAGGTDVAELEDTTGIDTLQGSGNNLQLYGTGYFVRSHGFGRVRVTGRGGADNVSIGAIDYVFERLGSLA